MVWPSRRVGWRQIDTPREQIVNAAISELGITRIVIAHRIETIVAADRIFAVQVGKLQDITAAMAGIEAQLQAAQSGESASNDAIDNAGEIEIAVAAE
jgi:ATP-binding cassette subfamily B protein RaxB